jgi:glucose-1-phosphate thymidylyltransferase
VLRPGKWDIPAYFGDGGMLNVHLAYLMAKLPFGTPYTLDQAYPFIRDSPVGFGFPDIIFQPNNAFKVLTEWQNATGADLILSVFPPNRMLKNS